MTEQIVDIVEANMPVSSDVEAAAKGAGAAAGEYAGRQAANASLADVRALANTNKSRLDVLTAAPAAGNTELTDIRVGCDGATYPTAGDAVRAQMAASIRARKLVGSMEPDAPYDDMDTIPVQSTVTYSYLGNVAHAPDGVSGGTVITYAGDGSNPAGRAQFLQDERGCIAVRCQWGSPAQWRPWQTLKLPDVMTARKLLGSMEPDAPYDDMDTIPVQSTVTYSYLGNVAHAPDGMYGGTVITYAGDSTKMAGRIQIMVGVNGRLAWRVAWGSPASWGDWRMFGVDDIPDEQTSWSSLALFERIGVIGDSYASGEIVLNGYHDCYPLSWGQIIARRNGIHCTNYSAGGMTTRTWLNHDKGLSLLQSSEPDNLYILALGINDCEKLGATYLGTIADMHDDASTNPDTYYGNYGRIISAIKTKAPNAKIIIMTMARTSGGNYPAYNTAIEQIATKAGIPLIRQSDDRFFRSTFYQTMLGGHPVGVTYAGMATAIERLFSKCAIDHIQYFRDYMG